MRETGARPLLRRAEPRDARAIVGLSALLDYPTSASALKARLVALDPEENVVLVAEEVGEVVDWVNVFRSHRLEEDAFAELGGLIAAPGQRGRGLGRLPMQSGEAWARERGCSMLRVRSHEKRVEAHEFYERVGYRRVERQ